MEAKEIYVPDEILKRYISVSMRGAKTKQVVPGEKWFAELPGFPGVWADGPSLKECLDTLAEVLREWVILKIADGDQDIPIVDDIDLRSTPL